MNNLKSNEPIVAIDIGAAHIVAAMAEPNKDDQELGFKILGVISEVTPKDAMYHGRIQSVDKIVLTLKKVIEDLENLTKCKATQVLIGVGSPDLQFQNRQATVYVQNSHIVGQWEVVRAESAAEKDVFNADKYQQLHAVNRFFMLDNTRYASPPLNREGVQLTVSRHLIAESRDYLNDIIKCAARSGIASPRLVAMPLAVGDFCLSAQQKEAGALCIDIGKTLSRFVLYRKGAPDYTGVIRFGGDQFSDDLSHYLNVLWAWDVGNHFKEKYGQLHTQDDQTVAVLEDDFEAFPDWLLSAQSNQHSMLNRPPARRAVASVLDACAKEWIEQILAQIEAHFATQGLSVPYHLQSVVLVGGGAQLKGLCQYLRHYLHLRYRSPIDVTLGGGACESSIGGKDAWRNQLLSKPVDMPVKSLLAFALRHPAVPRLGFRQWALDIFRFLFK